MNELRNMVLMFALMLSLSGLSNAQSSYRLRSPDGKIEVSIQPTDRLTYDVSFKGKPLLHNSQLSIDIDHNKLGVNPKVVSTKERSQNQILDPVVRQKFAKVRENYNELRLQLDGNYAVLFRAYN